MKAVTADTFATDSQVTSALRHVIIQPYRNAATRGHAAWPAKRGTDLCHAAAATPRAKVSIRSAALGRGERRAGRGHSSLICFNPLRGFGPRRTTQAAAPGSVFMFQSAPRLWAAENKALRKVNSKELFVSIRSAALGRGERTCCPAFRAFLMFQSAPRLWAAENCVRVREPRRFCSFQSAPRLWAAENDVEPKLVFIGQTRFNPLRGFGPRRTTVVCFIYSL